MYTHAHNRAGAEWMHTTTCCFRMSTHGGDGGGRGVLDLRCSSGCSDGGCGGGGNLAQSCALGMTSLGGPAQVWCLGIASAAKTGCRGGAAEAETRMRPESLFYLACDGEIQINSCQSGGLQGKGLQRWGRTGLGWDWEGENRWEAEGGGRGCRGWGLTDEVSVSPEFNHRLVMWFTQAGDMFTSSWCVFIMIIVRTIYRNINITKSLTVKI